MTELIDELYDYVTYGYEYIPTYAGCKHKNVKEYTSSWHILIFVNKGMNRLFVPSLSQGQPSPWAKLQRT